MTKRKKSSTKFVTVRVLDSTRPKYLSPYGTPETLDHLRKSEAREWIRRYLDKIGELGAENGRSWWEGVKADIAKRRGQAALDELINNMRTEREKGKLRG